jgi:hypothetical protein
MRKLCEVTKQVHVSGESVMKFVICTIALAASAITPGAHADVPRGPDAVNSAFRMLAQEAISVTAPVPITGNSNRVFESWVNRATRNEVSSLEAGFAHMLARRDDAPTRLIVRGKPDPVALAIAETLRSQRVDAQRLALRD